MPTEKENNQKTINVSQKMQDASQIDWIKGGPEAMSKVGIFTKGLFRNGSLYNINPDMTFDHVRISVSRTRGAASFHRHHVDTALGGKQSVSHDITSASGIEISEDLIHLYKKHFSLDPETQLFCTVWNQDQAQTYTWDRKNLRDHQRINLTPDHIILVQNQDDLDLE